MKVNLSNSAFIALLIGFLAGIIIGLIASPVKNGIAIGSYNGCGNRISNSNKISGSNKVNKTKGA